MTISGLKKFNLSLILVVLVGFLLRVPFLDKYPIGFTPDEASFGYDAYSLLETGKDQWGTSWPLTFKSFGDSKLPLYTYLAMPSVAALGLNEFATRLPSALVGVLAIISTYFMVLEVFKNKKTALLSSFLLAISPWHFTLSRGAFEANLTVFFMSLAVYYFLRGIKDKKYFLPSAILFGLNLFTYHSARLIAPLIVLSLVLIYREDLGLVKFGDIKKGLLKYRVPVAVFSFFLIIAFYEVLGGGSSRAADITIFYPTDKWMAVFNRRYEAVFEGLSSPVARIFSNKMVYLFDAFTNAYSTYLSPQFLFTLGPAELTYGMIGGRGAMYLFEVFFVIGALFYFVRSNIKKEKGLMFILVWILLSPIPAALTKGPGYAGNRAAVMMPAIQALSAFGGVYLWEVLRSKYRGKKIRSVLLYGFFAFALINMVFVAEDYFYHAPRNSADSMLFGRKEAVEYVETVKDDYKEIIFSRSLSEPQIFVAFYGGVDPSFYQKESVDWLRFEEEGRSFVDQLGEYSLGKYVFRNVESSRDTNLDDVLVVGKHKEFPQDMVIKKTIYFPNQDPAIYIVDPNDLGR